MGCRRGWRRGGRGDPPVLVANPTRARARLGWQRVYTDLAEIVATAWRWQAGRSGADPVGALPPSSSGSPAWPPPHPGHRHRHRHHQRPPGCSFGLKRNHHRHGSEI